MSSSNSDDFFGDAESESEVKENVRDELRSATPEGSRGASPEEFSSKDDETKKLDISNGERNGDDNNENDGVSSECVQDAVEEDDEERSERLRGDEPVMDSDRSDELEKLFNVSGTTPFLASPQGTAHSSRRPASARCRVEVVVDPPPTYRSQKGKHMTLTCSTGLITKRGFYSEHLQLTTR